MVLGSSSTVPLKMQIENALCKTYSFKTVQSLKAATFCMRNSKAMNNDLYARKENGTIGTSGGHWYGYICNGLP